MDLDYEQFTRARRALVHNPFTVTEVDLRTADEWFGTAWKTVRDTMLGLCRDSRYDEARKGILAYAHFAARAERTRMTIAALEELVATCSPFKLGLDVGGLRSIAWTLERFYKAAKRIIGVSPSMQQLRRDLWTACFGPNLVETLSHRSTLRRHNILLLGESGTGKELAAEVILAAVLVEHPEGAPKQAINCAAIPEELAEAELFGAEKGAHSKADVKRVGRLAEASRGCMFLDEVADLPPKIQAKLLSVVSNGQLTPLGANKPIQIDVRYVAATSRPIHALVDSDSFRPDLLERLGHTVLTIPPLRDRREDIDAIGSALIDDLTGEARLRATPYIAGMPNADPAHVPSPAARAYEWLRTEAPHYPWRGNVRELHAAIRGLVLGFQRGTSRLESAIDDGRLPPNIATCRATEQELVEWYFQRVLRHTKHNAAETARILGRDVSTVSRRKKKM